MDAEERFVSVLLSNGPLSCNPPDLFVAEKLMAFDGPPARSGRQARATKTDVLNSLAANRERRQMHQQLRERMAAGAAAKSPPSFPCFRHTDCTAGHWCQLSSVLECLLYFDAGQRFLELLGRDAIVEGNRCGSS